MIKEIMQLKKLDESTSELLIYGDIRKKSLFEVLFEVESDAQSGLSIKQALDMIDTDNLNVRINSMGGSVSEGLAIYNLLKDFKGNLTTTVDGFACSAASVIFMAGQTRIVPESGLLMIHNAWTEAVGDSNAMRKAADDLEKITQPSVNIYVSNTGLEESAVKEMMDKETWITSSEALEMGFATQISMSDANQSLEQSYFFNAIKRNKMLENEIAELESKVINQEVEDDFF